MVLNSPPYAGLPTGGAISPFLGSETSLFISYVVALLVIAVGWTLHRGIFRHIRGADATLGWTNIAFLMFIAVTSFVTGLNGLYGSTEVSVALYSAVQCAAGVTMGPIALRVSGKPELAHPTADRLSLERTAQPSFGIAGIFSLAASIASYDPTCPGYALYTIIIVTWHSGGFTHRERPVRPRGPLPLRRLPCREAYDAGRLGTPWVMSTSRLDHGQRVGAIAMIVGPIQFVVVTTAEALILIAQGQNYSFQNNTISNLGDPSLVAFPYYWMLNLSAIALGALVLVGLMAMRRGVPPGAFGRLGVITYALVGIGAIGVGIFNEHLNYPIHISAASLAFIAAGFTLLFVGLASWKDPRWHAWTIPSIVGFFVTAIALVMFGLNLSWFLGHGGWERLVVAPALLWVIVVGIKFLREGSSGPASARVA